MLSGKRRLSWRPRCLPRLLILSLLGGAVADQMIDPTKSKAGAANTNYCRILVSNFAVCWFVMSLSE